VVEEEHQVHRRSGRRTTALDRKKAIKCDMCAGIEGGPSCVRACPTGAAIRVSPDEFLTVARLENEGA
jgi:Fe-S-cluster-containing hydrogenase component 2